ncbi:NAD kinase [Viscerimonas tarda]
MKIGIFGSRYQQPEQIGKIFNILSENEVEIYIRKRFYDYLHTSFDLEYKLAGLIENDDFSIDIALSIGGDGTFLKTASLVGKKDIPILGINTGRLGFLADISDKDIESTLTDLVAGRYRVEKRTQLTLSTESKAFRGYNYALNEVAILKQDSASMITIHAHVNGEYLTSYQADGLIVATPTGSTAYSLSVGGPIMTPDSSNFILSAIAPHSLTTRPLVIGDDSVITLDIESRNQNFLVSLDGRSNILSTGTRLEIKKGHYPLKVVKRVGHTFYETLREKLMWGADPRKFKV